MPRDCGSCNFCCKFLHVPDINKPALMLCWWTGIHGGCQRQAEKPKDPLNPQPGEAPELSACAQFECLWLASQKHPNEAFRMPRSMRPDISHVMMGPPNPADKNVLFVHVDPTYTDAWRGTTVENYLRDNILANGGQVEIIVGGNRFSFDG